MLARLARELPLGDYLYEPKWDGFRCLAFRDGADVDLRSRNQRPLARYFPEVVRALRTLPVERFPLDGEAPGCRRPLDARHGSGLGAAGTGARVRGRV